MLSRLFSYASRAIVLVVVVLFVGHWAINLAMIAKRSYLGLPVADLLSFERSVAAKEFYPWVYWRRSERISDNVNIDDTGRRKTVKDPVEGATKVFMFGGSTVWGAGVTDANTIPSLLQAKLGRDFDVHNLGEKIYVSVQETNALLERLAKGDRPDVVIFYDGFSDGFAGVYSPAVPRDVRNMRDAFYRQQELANHGVFGFLIEAFRQSNWQLLINYLEFGDSRGDIRDFKEEWDTENRAKAKDNAIRVVTYWLENCRQVRAIGHEYGFKALCVWQPNALNGQKNLTEEEISRISKKGVTSGAREIFQTLYSVSSEFLRGRQHNNVFFMGDVFRNVDEAVYANHFLLNEAGNAIVADRLHELLRE